MDAADSIGVYGEAKAEYTRQLCIFLVPALESYFLDLLKDTKEVEKDQKRVLWQFQDALKQFPDWNVDKVQRETEKIVTSTKCDYLEEILTAVFIAHTKVLSAIRLTSRQKKLQITIPKLEHFLHRTMSECARLLWSNAYLFAENGTSIDRQKNLRQVEQLLHEGVLQSIRGMLPVKSILKEYLADDGEEETTAVTDTSGAKPQEEDAADEIPPVVPEGESSTDEKKAETDAPVVKQPEPAPETPAALPPAESAPESKPVPEVSAPAVPLIDLSAAATAPAPAPTIIVDTEPPVVSFTQMDAVFDGDNPDKSTIRASPQGDDDDEDGYADGIVIDESVAPEALDDFEDLGEPAKKDEIVAFDEDEFESL